ncbi:putative carboxylesterase 13 [Camellia lanceoleosa]|uniref:Carboxylesterase 13 n=1 Tax=Camellia lanceoleosa TaxID=1840588 RepID=A0ACC0IEX9_9ERIC|nr:putative carboxylesterase 13 [Camellia lanceoleosa]
MDVKQSSCGAAVAAELPWKTRLAVHLGSFLLDVCRLSHRILRFVRNLEPKSPPSSKAINGVSSSDITVHPSITLRFRLHLPSSSSSSPTTLLPLLLYFHGGFLCSAANSNLDLFAATSLISSHRRLRQLPPPPTTATHPNRTTVLKPTNSSTPITPPYYPLTLISTFVFSPATAPAAT